MPSNVGSRPSDFDRLTFTNSITIYNRLVEYRASASITALTITIGTSSNYEAWIKFTAGATFTPSFPSSLKWIGDKLTGCTSGKTYEISIKDGVAIACEVGDGT